MEPITVILTALTFGMAAALKDTAAQAVKDVYAGLKTLIQDRYKVSLSGLERNQKSETQLAAVEENLRATDADKDVEVFNKAKELVDAVEQHDRDIAKAKAVVLKKVRAECMEIERVLANGNVEAVVMDDVEVKGRMIIKDIAANSTPKASGQ